MQDFGRGHQKERKKAGLEKAMMNLYIALVIGRLLQSGRKRVTRTKGEADKDRGWAVTVFLRIQGGSVVLFLSEFNAAGLY